MATIWPETDYGERIRRNLDWFRRKRYPHRAAVAVWRVLCNGETRTAVAESLGLTAPVVQQLVAQFLDQCTDYNPAYSTSIRSTKALGAMIPSLDMPSPPTPDMFEPA